MHITDADFTLPAFWKKKTLFIRNSSDRKFFSTLPDAGSGVRQDFYRLCEQRFAAAEALNAQYATFAPELEYDSEANTGKILRNAFGVYFGFAEKYRIPLALELRIPSNAAAAPDKFCKYKHALLYPLRTMCVLHPHEPGALEAMENFSAQCKFDCDMLRVCFDAASGNYLSGTLLNKILTFIRPAGSAAPVLIFDPGKNADISVFQDLNQLVKMELNK